MSHAFNHRLVLEPALADDSAPSRAATAPPRLRPASVLHARVVAGAGGGPDKTILRSAAHVDPGRYRVAAAYIHPRGDPHIEVLRAHAAAAGCPFWAIPEAGAVDPRTVGHLLRLCRRLRVDIWHGHDYKSNALGLLLRRFHPMALVTTLHGWTWETVRTRLYYHVDNLCLPRYDHAMAVSPQLLEHCRTLGMPPGRLTYIPNAIEIEQYQPRRQRAEARADLGLHGRSLMIGVVGRLSPEKGPHRALRVLPALREVWPHAELHFIGDGPEREDLEALTGEFGLGDVVRFWGWQADTRRFYEAMDLLLLPSHTEGFPNVVLEAMAMGVPVAATRVGAVGELLGAGRYGVVLDAQDEESWPSALGPLLVNPARRSAAAEEARRHVEVHYSFRRRVEQEQAVYDHVLHRRALAAPGVEPAAEPRRRAA